MLLQNESIMAESDSQDVLLTMETIEHSQYADYRYTILAGRIAAICGVQVLVESAAISSSQPSAVHASQSSAPLLLSIHKSCTFVCSTFYLPSSSPSIFCWVKISQLPEYVLTPLLYTYSTASWICPHTLTLHLLQEGYAVGKKE